MRKYINLILSVSVALLAAACAKEINGPAETVETYSAVISASVDGADTKTVLNFAERKSYWFGEENISVLGSDGRGYKFSANLAEKTLTADFTYSGTEEFAETEVLAVYPETIYDWNLSEKTVSNITIPTPQYPTLESFAVNAVPAIAYTENIADGLSFRNIPALIMFTTNEANGYKVTFKGKNGERVAGKFDVTYGDVLTVAPSDDNDVTSVSLGDLTMEKGRPYFLAVAPQNYSEGFVVELNGAVVYEYEGSKTLESNKIYNIGEINIPAMDQWYLCGTMTENWAAQIEMSKIENGWYLAENVTIYAQEDCFKFKQGDVGSWPKEYGSPEKNKKFDKNVEATLTNSASQDIFVKENGVYDVMFNPTTAKIKLVYKEAITKPIRIYAKNNTDWTSVNIHLWVQNGDDGTDITTWPGVAMTYDAELGLWYHDVSIEHHLQTLGYIFNNGAEKTADKFITLKKDGFTAQINEPGTPEAEPIRIHIKHNWIWNYGLWCYIPSENDANIFDGASWPGVKPEGVVNVNGADYSYWTVPEQHVGKTVNVIISDGKDDWSGSDQQTETYTNVVLSENIYFTFEWNGANCLKKE